MQFALTWEDCGLKWLPEMLIFLRSIQSNSESMRGNIIAYLCPKTLGFSYQLKLQAQNVSAAVPKLLL